MTFPSDQPLLTRKRDNLDSVTRTTNQTSSTVISRCAAMITRALNSSRRGGHHPKLACDPSPFHSIQGPDREMVLPTFGVDTSGTTNQLRTTLPPPPGGSCLNPSIWEAEAGRSL